MKILADTDNQQLFIFESRYIGRQI